MTTKADIQEFVSQKVLAVVGVSRSKKKFSFIIYKELKAKGYQVYAINPNTDNVEGDPCFASVESLPQKVDGLVVVVPPAQTEKVVRDAAAAGIKHIWIQQGAESQDAIDFCKKEGINTIHHQCILMFLEPAALPHKVHRCLRGMVGKLPK